MPASTTGSLSNAFVDELKIAPESSLIKGSSVVKFRAAIKLRGRILTLGPPPPIADGVAIPSWLGELDDVLASCSIKVVQATSGSPLHWLPLGSLALWMSSLRGSAQSGGSDFCPMAPSGSLISLGELCADADGDRDFLSSPIRASIWCLCKARRSLVLASTALSLWSSGLLKRYWLPGLGEGGFGNRSNSPRI